MATGITPRRFPLPRAARSSKFAATAGGNSGTSAAQILYSSASLTTDTVGTGQYVIAFTGVDFNMGLPVDVVGSIVTSGSANSASGTITGGEMDLNTGLLGTAFAVPVISGSYQVGALDGRTSMTVTLSSSNNNNVASSFNFQLTLTTNQHALLIDFDASDTGSGTQDAQNPAAFGNALNGRFAFQYFGFDQNLLPVSVAGTVLASNNSIPVNNPNAPVNTQDFTYMPLNNNTLTVVTNDITLSGVYTNVADSFGRGTITMNSADLGTITFAYYMIDLTHLKMVECDPSQPYILFGEAYSSPIATTPLTGGVALTFGGGANGAPYAGGAVFALNGGTVGGSGTRHQQQRRRQRANQRDDHRRVLRQRNVIWQRPGSLYAFAHDQQRHPPVHCLYFCDAIGNS